MDYSLLLKAPLFRGLSVEEIERTLAVVSYRTRKFKSGNLIVQSGEQVDSLMIVIKGIVKGEMTDYAGRVIKIEDIPAPGALAPAFLFGSKNRYPVNIMVVSDAEILLIGKFEFLKMLKRSDRILVNFLDMISNRSQFLSEKIKFLNFKTIKGKLAQFILQRAGADKKEIILEITQNDLADFFGVARPSVARALGEIEDEGLIEARGKKIKILDKAGLAKLTAD